MPQNSVTIQIKPNVPAKVNITSMPPQTINLQGTVIQMDSNVFQLVVNEVPSGLVNGSNAVFTALNDFQPESVEVFLNGIKQKITEDYQTSGTRTIQFFSSPTPNENIIINYLKA